MDIKKNLYVFGEEEPETVIYLLLDYFLYENMEVNFKSKAKKIVILLKNTPLAENYKKYFEVFYVKTKEYNEIKKLLEKILKNKNRKKTKIIPAIEEFIYLASSLSQELKIQGMSPEEAKCLLNKIKMKEIIKKNNIPTHKYEPLSKEKIKKDINSYITFLEREINYPMFLKPTELIGSKGTQKINNRRELKKNLLEITEESHDYEMDEFVSETIINCEVAVINGKIVFFRARILHNTLHTFSKGSSYSTCLVPPSHQQYKKAFFLVSKIVEAYKGIFKNRCINFEFIEQNMENLLFLEFNYRRAGCTTCYILDYQFKDGFNFEVLDLDLAFGAKEVEVYDDDFESDYEYYSGNILFPVKKGIVTGFEELPECLSSEIKLELKVKVGQDIEELAGNYEFIYIPAFIIIRNKCFTSLYREIQRLRSWYPYTLE